MKVKIGDKIFDSCDQPIVIILQDDDLHNFYKLKGNLYRYLFYSGDIDLSTIKDLLRVDLDPDHGA